jgi:hypothetical protein
MIYYPNGTKARGYLVPAEREAGVKSSVRRLVFITLICVGVVLIPGPRLLDSWVPDLALPWLLGGALVTTVVAVGGIIAYLGHLTAGLPVAPTRD